MWVLSFFSLKFKKTRDLTLDWICMTLLNSQRKKTSCMQWVSHYSSCSPLRWWCSRWHQTPSWSTRCTTTRDGVMSRVCRIWNQICAIIYQICKWILDKFVKIWLKSSRPNPTNLKNEQPSSAAHEAVQHLVVVARRHRHPHGRFRHACRHLLQHNGAVGHGRRLVQG